MKPVSISKTRIWGKWAVERGYNVADWLLEVASEAPVGCSGCQDGMRERRVLGIYGKGWGVGMWKRMRMGDIVLMQK